MPKPSNISIPNRMPSASISASTSPALRANNQINVHKIFEHVKNEFANIYVEKSVTKQILKEAGNIVASSARSKAPVADRDVKLYSTAKVSKRYRAPKGKGNVKKIFRRGNLRDSIQVLDHGRFKKIMNAIFVGPRYPKASYAHLPHFGSKFIKKKNPFMAKAFESTRGQVVQHIYKRYRSEARKVISEAYKLHGNPVQ